MPTAASVSSDELTVVERYLVAMRTADRRTGQSTTRAAHSCQAKIDRAGGWNRLSLQEQIDAVRKARSFSSWLMVTGQAMVDPLVFSGVELRLGNAARLFCPQDYRWFTEICRGLSTPDWDRALQWNTLAKITAITGVPPGQVSDTEFDCGRTAILDVYRARQTHSSGRSMAAIFYRLRLTLFHAGRISALRQPTQRSPVSVTGWSVVAPGFAATARRYVEQVRLSLRPATVKHIEHDLRRFGTWLADVYPDVASCADLDRPHIEAFKTWLSTHPTDRTGKPLNRVSVKNTLINLHCFFNRISEWGYPNPPTRPLVFIGDLPIIDKPLPRFLDDAAAAKLLRTARTDPDPLSRLIVELLARTGVRIGELLALNVDAVVQIGSAYWLRIPIGKMHSDRYIPLHPQLKQLLDDWIAHHRPDNLRSERLLIEHNRPITRHRVTTALHRLGDDAGIGHVTAHRLRHTLATQAINRGMSLDAIAALLGHKTLAMTMVYARIADRTVADQYFAVTEKVEALYDQPHRLPNDDEGSEMRKLRTEMHRRMLGNGYCARPVEMDCHFESICESCSFFVTTIEFRLTLEQQRDDAANKGQVARQKIFNDILNRLDTEAS